MLWALFPILASVFYCASGYLENHLTDNAIPKKRAGSYTVMHIPGFLLALILMFALFGHAVMFVSLVVAIGFMIAGAVNVIGSVYYFKALQMGDTVDITILGQLSPLVSLVLGVLILGETITLSQAIGFVFIMIASLIVVFGDTGKKGKKVNISPAMIVICLINMFFSILSDIIFAYYLGDRTADYMLFAQSFFYFELGSLLASVVGVILFVPWRKATKVTFMAGKKHTKNLVSSMIENVSFLMAEFLYKMGLILSPVVALITVIGKVSGLFASLFMNMVLGKLFPRVIRAKKMTKKMMLQYSFAAVLIVIGVLVMN